MTPRGTALVGVASVVGVAVTVASAGTVLLYVWWAVVPGLAVAAVACGLVRHRPRRLLPWLVLTGGLTLLWIGWTLSAAVGAGVGSLAVREVLPHLRDAVYLAAYPTLGVAGLLMTRARTASRDRDDVIDALIVMTALATILWAWIFDTPAVPDLGTLDRLWIGLSPLLLSVVVSAAARMLFSGGERLPATWLMMAASVLALLGNLWTFQLVRGSATTQAVGIDVVWVLAFVAVGAAALDPSMRQLTEPLPTVAYERATPIDRLVLLGMAMLAAPLAHLWMGEGSAEHVTVVFGGAVVALLAVWRVARLLRERDRARRAADASAARDALIARVGHLALDDRPVDELLHLAGGLLAEELPGVGIAPTPATGARAASHPIDDGDATIAWIVAPTSPEGGPGELRHDEFLGAFAALLSSAARRRAAEDRLRHDALHDTLTGLPNRALLLDRLAHLLARRDASHVTVVFLDLDGFKAVNDTLGHDAGDRVLCEVADRLAGVVRPGDTVARLAGDEFVVVVPDADVAAVEALTRRLESATTIDCGDAPGVLGVSASIGVATGRSSTIGAEGLLREADTAMYRAKHERPRGRAGFTATT